MCLEGLGKTLWLAGLEPRFELGTSEYETGVLNLGVR